MVIRKIFDKFKSQPKTPAPRAQRAPRIRVDAHASVSFIMESPVEGTPLVVANISATGIGFLNTSLNQWPQVGEFIRGKVTLEGAGEPESFEIKAKIVRISEIVGCHFDPEIPKLAASLVGHFKTQIRAIQLSRIRAEVLQKPERGNPHFFCSSGSDEFYYVEEGNQLIYFNVSFNGFYLEGDRSGKFNFAKLVADTPSGKAAYKGSDLVQTRTPLEEQNRIDFLKFIRSIEGASKEVLKKIAELIERADR